MRNDRERPDGEDRQPRLPAQLPVIEEKSDGLERGWAGLVAGWKVIMWGALAFVSVLVALLIAKGAWTVFLYAWERIGP